MKNYILKYGIAGGVFSVALGLLNWFTIAQWYGPLASQTVGYLSIIIALMCIPLGIKYFRDQLNGGNVTFGQGFKIGLGIASVFSIISFFYSLLFFVFAGDRFGEWRKKGLTETELAELKKQMEQTPDFMMTPWFQGFILALSVFMIGLIISLISILVLKNTPTGNIENQTT